VINEIGRSAMPNFIRIAAILLVALAALVTVPRSPSLAATWIDGSIVRRGLLYDLLRHAQYDRLESELTAHQKKYETGQVPDAAVSNDYFAFWNSDAALEPKLLDWLRAMPKSYAARLAAGVYYVRLGVLSRGTAFASETAKTQWRGMRDYFDQGQPHLREALRLNDRLMLAYSTLAVTEKAMGNTAEMSRLLKAGLAKDPSSRAMPPLPQQHH
jgi:hypothetical protein